MGPPPESNGSLPRRSGAAARTPASTPSVLASAKVLERTHIRDESNAGGDGDKARIRDAPPTEVDSRDRRTPDDWVPRHPQLVRLTGRHPFNCEAPLKLLHDDVTPPSLHYVRNHAAVPQLDADTHRVEVCGAVDAPGVFSVAELLEMGGERVTVPATLVCAGNRRKEQNLVKQTAGFNWGAGGVSTTHWTGVRLSEVLRRCGVREPARGARHVCFEGADSLPKGAYGTSIPVSVAMDPYGDVILAVEQNGRPLMPDHGYPIRVIVPGWIGGRMVKWLAKIEVGASESTNYYHYFDNRILPPQVDKERANAEGWWYHPEYLFNELNINSAVVHPDHNELLPLAGANAFAEARYTIHGYAYSGGGRRITRVEITFDEGATWELCGLRQPIGPNDGGRYYTWAKFEYAVDVMRLFCCNEFAVRAWDQSNNVQPHALTWNVMGMGNNYWFKVRINPCHDPATGAFALQFEHPTVPGSAAGGWMDASAERAPASSSAAKSPGGGGGGAGESATRQAPAPAEPRPTSTPAVEAGKTVHGSNVYEQAHRKRGDLDGAEEKSARAISMSEVERHDSEEDCWIVVQDRVYDCTRYLKEHPGGAAAILMNSGTDSTEDFEAIHSDSAWRLLENFYIGNLVAEASDGGDDDDGQGDGGKAPSMPSTTTIGDARASQQRAQRDRAEAPPGPSLLRKQRVAYSHSSADMLRLQLPTDANPYPVVDGTDGASHVALNPKKWLRFCLVDRLALNHNTRRFRFALPSAEHALGLPVGHHMFLRAEIGGATVMRAYTPTSAKNARGFFELVIKVYARGVHPAYPEGGKMSQYLDALAIGDGIDVKGPLGHFEYLGMGRFTLAGKEERHARRIGLIAGGTGITPAYQVIKAVLSDEHDDTELWLLYANQCEEDILLRDELDACAAQYPNLHVWYTLNHPPSPPRRRSSAAADDDDDDDNGHGGVWPYSTGFIDERMVRERLPPSGDDVFVAMCGPPPMIDKACVPNLRKVGFGDSQYMSF